MVGPTARGATRRIISSPPKSGPSSVQHATAGAPCESGLGIDKRGKPSDWRIQALLLAAMSLRDTIRAVESMREILRPLVERDLANALGALSTDSEAGLSRRDGEVQRERVLRAVVSFPPDLRSRLLLY